jgi:hypothetical protein
VDALIVKYPMGDGTMRWKAAGWVDARLMFNLAGIETVTQAQPADQKSISPHPRRSILYFVQIGGEIPAQAQT